MASVALICTDGEITVLADGAPHCSGIWAAAPMPAPFSIEQLDPAILGQACLAGFGLMLSIWLSGRAVIEVVNFLRPYLQR